MQFAKFLFTRAGKISHKLKSWLKSLPKFVYIIIGLILLLVVFGMLAWQPLLVLSLQARAGDRIEGFIQDFAGDYENFFACQMPALTDLPSDERLDRATALLEKAKGLQPQNAQTDLLLGRALCLQGDFPLAVKAFESFSQAHPENPLGSFEAAFAHFTSALTSNELSEAERTAQEGQSRAILAGMGYTGDYFFQEGEAALTRYPTPAYPVAWYWYRLSGIFQPLPEEAAFRIELLDLAFSGKTEQAMINNEDLVLPLDDALTIQPSALFMLADGSPIIINEYDQTPVALIYGRWNLGCGLIDISEKNTYCLTITALDRPPEPTQVEISLDFKGIMQVELPDGDDTWKTFTKDVQLSQGLHLLGIRLANDAKVNGLDRNGHIAEIILQKCHD